MSRTRFGLYQPFIEDRNVRRLYRLKTSLNEALQTRLPMTVVLNRILDHFFDSEAASGAEASSWLAAIQPPSKISRT